MICTDTLPHLPTLFNTIILILLGVTIFTLFIPMAYLVTRKRGEKVTWHQASRPGLVLFKSVVVYTSRYALLLWAIISPLVAVSLLTVLYALFIYSLTAGAWSPSPLTLGASTAFTLATVVAVGVFVFYFLNRYGAVYKLATASFGRDEVKRYLNKRLELYLVLNAVDMVYFITLVTLLVTLASIPSLPSRVVLGTVVALMLAYVIPNKKYDNAINLMEKICRKVECHEDINIQTEKSV